MKKIITSALAVALLFIGLQTYARTEPADTTKLAAKVKKGATKAGKKIGEIGGKSEAAIMDKKYKGKTGPNGETVYINKSDHYYYVNKAGHNVYLKKSQLK